ncbi:23S rRNA (adenine(2030)-N(6))-methyltransferase RlmJ [Candidatus Pandoraea novymonadis]|uniref:Ribosomal RNA large subunit methyltransferase J n=1 Tax=Candidatus Pandoraea novymonadis TaxID=1808959 RepID=A0ABX5FEM1_9BURK|nr:23S rRNA (adenine(2030)-N(6))-methyltransferase RlmJ [Candidatus Pandoraea novymonadis]PSB92130.1 Ribosomal RNA large subunit methyltransferase J [Candidatus Pandoraea novymonadis]
MFSYRHAFHAGNHADVLKHMISIQCIDYMRQKDSSFWYIDTHAGAGVYALDGHWAEKTAEYETGIARLWTRKDLPQALKSYVFLVRKFNKNGQLRYYPGSPYFALQLLGDGDRLRLFEKHPKENRILSENFAIQGKNVKRRTMIFLDDGFTGLKALLPPSSRRAYTLIDPSYEDKLDYGRVVKTLQEAIKRFATGTYAIWYPKIQRREAVQLTEKLKRLPLKNWLNVSMTVSSPKQGEMGLHGSGMFIINPPFTLMMILKETMPWLTKVCSQDGKAEFVLEGEG